MTGSDAPEFRRPDWDGWKGTSVDPNDVQFGDVVRPVPGEHIDDLDVVIAGEPYDGAVIGRRGARAGPTAIRRSLARAKASHLGVGRLHDAGPDERPVVLRVGDVGDVAIDAESVVTAQTQVRAAAERLHESSALPVVLGGDNSLTYANVAPLLDRGSVGVVNFDAHLDCRELVDGPTSGTPYRQLLEEGLDGYACVGARHFETSGTYVDYVDEQGGEVVSAATVGRSTGAALERVGEALAGVDHLYLSVDCDVLDAAAAPGVSAPTPGGITARELFELLATLAADDRLAGVEVVECAPPLDEDGRTVDAASRAVAHTLAGRARVPRAAEEGGDDA
jgi:formimidoylglutamase